MVELTKNHKNPDLSFLKPVILKNKVLTAFHNAKNNSDAFSD
jgi:hypothetical protein